MKLIAGLGNPGERYQKTRHNIGFLTIDYLASFYGIPLKKGSFQALWGKGEMVGSEVLLVKPQTYMNLSGQSLRGFKNFFKLSNKDILIVYDDLDLPFGRLRIKHGGGSGGHRGVRSIIEALGGEDIPRIRMGIGRPVGYKAVDYVLSPFNKTEKELINDLLEIVRQAIETILQDGIDMAMNRFNALQGDNILKERSIE